MTELFGWLLKLLNYRSKREKEQTERVIQYIDTCLEHMNKIIETSDQNLPTVSQSRLFLQQAHQEIATHLNGVASTKECDIIKKSLMSARIYFHALTEGKVTNKQILIDYQERNYTYSQHIYNQQEYRESSYESFLSALIMHEQAINFENLDYERTKIREVCLEDIARISSLRETLKTRKVNI